MTALMADLPLVQDEHGGRRRRRMQAFNPSVRARVEDLTSAARALEDLADSFPALLFAIVTGYSTAVRRRQAVQLVIDGAPLRLAGEAIGLAWWTRRLPSQAFFEPLRSLPDDPAFSERIASFLPTAPDQARTWLWTVSHAAAGCHPNFALWAASWASRQRKTFDAVVGREQFRYMTAWAWHADQSQKPAASLLRRPWTPQTGLRRALDELTNWRRRLRLAMCLDDASTSAWIDDGEALGYQFVALRTPVDFITESEAMDNCLDQFADRLEAGRSRVYSVRKEGRPVADLEIVADELEAGMPTVHQLRGPRNRRAAPEIWRATYAWLGASSLRPLGWSPATHTATVQRRLARNYWQPYLAAVPADLADEIADMLSSDLGFRLDPRRRERRAAPAKSSKCRDQAKARAPLRKW